MSDGYEYDDDDFLPGGGVPEVERVRERMFQRGLSPDPAGLGIPLGNKNCIECGATFTRVRQTPTCLRCE